MGKFRVTSPDGKAFEVTAPEGASQDDVLAYAQKQFSSPQQAQPQAPGIPYQPIGRLGRFARGVEDPYDAGAQMLVNATPDNWQEALNSALGDKAAPTAKQFNTRQALEERTYQGQRAAAGNQGFDGWRTVGNMVGSAPLMRFLPAGMTGSLFSTAVKSGLSGGGLSAFQPVTDDKQDFWTQKKGQIGTGIAVGAVFGPLVNMVGKFISPKVDSAVKYLRDRGVTPTPGKMLGNTAGKVEDALTSVNPAIAAGQRRSIEEFNRATYNEILSSIGVKFQDGVSVGRDGVRWVGDQISNKYNQLLPQLTFRPDQTLAQETSIIRQMAANLPKREARAFLNFWDDKVQRAMAPNGVMSGAAFKEIQSAMKKEAATFLKSTDGYQQKLGKAFEALVGSFDDALERSNPNLAPQLQAIDTAWAKLIPLENAAKGVGGGGVITPAQLLMGIRTASDTVRQRGFTRGLAGELQKLGEAGQKILGNKYPDSGTAMRSALGLGALGGVSMVSPGAAVGLGASTLGYTPVGQRMLASTLADRPNIAPQIAAGLRNAAVPARVAALSAIFGQPTPQAPYENK